MLKAEADKGAGLLFYRVVIGVLCVGCALSVRAVEPEDLPNVKARSPHLEFMPCSDCHEYMEPNPEMRVLEEAPHVAEVDHAGGVFWCTTCHSLNHHDHLKLFSGEEVSIEESYRVCGQCHGAVYRDWSNGVHGKRIGNWYGERTVYNCTECHDPHQDPGIKPRPPQPPPGIREGLQHRHRHGQHSQPEWRKSE